ncbi:hypothetical protein [Streptomyces chartreusis]
MPVPAHEHGAPSARPGRPGWGGRQLHGIHVFTGKASYLSEALHRTHEAYGAALAAYTAGLNNPGR